MLVIDPYIFLPSPSIGKYDVNSKGAVKSDLKKIIAFCKSQKTKVIFDKKIWKDIELNFIRDLTANPKDAELDVALTIFRKEILIAIDFSENVSVRTWGLNSLFYGVSSVIDKNLADAVAKSLLYCIGKNFPVAIFSKEIPGRNINIIKVKNTFLIERTRWRIYISQKGFPNPYPVPCITCERNILVDWTARHDVNLPSSGKYAFVPKKRWDLKRTKISDVMNVKPVFIDILGNGWARPDTGGSPYHWDVYIRDPKWRDKFGVDQVNISRHGLPTSEGVEGTIHHIPTGKAFIVKG